MKPSVPTRIGASIRRPQIAEIMAKNPGMAVEEAKALITSNVYPKCFGKYRSPQSDAENCCHDCKHDEICLKEFKK